MHAILPAHLVLPDMIILIVFDQDYKVMKLLIMQVASTFYHFIPLPSRYTPQYPLLLCPDVLPLTSGLE
jgi:hypothetical protein